MNVLFTTMPYWGGLRPLVPLAHAVRSAGHRVAVAAPESFCSTIARHGLEPLAAGLDRTPERPDPSFVEVRASHEDEWGWLFGTWVGGLRAQSMAVDLLELAAAWRPDLIVREATEFGGCLAAEALGVPHASVRPRPAPSRLSYGVRGGLAPVLGERRLELGLPPDPENEMPHRYLELAFLPPSFFGRAAGYSDRTRFVNFGLAGLDLGGIRHARRRPSAYASLGTLWYREPRVMETIVAALSREHLDVVISAGDEEAAARLRSVAAAQADPMSAMTVHASVDQVAALREADVFVTHTGINSVREALSLGVPMVAVPIWGDQPYNAERCVKLGVACRLATAGLSTDQVGGAVRSVLATSAYRHAAGRARAAVAALPPVSAAVEALEELAATGRPVRRRNDRRSAP